MRETHRGTRRRIGRKGKGDRDDWFGIVVSTRLVSACTMARFGDWQGS